jgi:hypothetical protein
MIVASIELFATQRRLLFFCHADAAKLESTLEGLRKRHKIAMEELNTQLQKSLAENTHLEEQLKDQQRINLEKQKEVDDLCQATIENEAQRKGFNKVLDHFRKTLLGSSFSPYFSLVCYKLLLERCLNFSAMQLHSTRRRLTWPQVCTSPLTPSRRSWIASSTQDVAHVRACRLLGHPLFPP